MLLDETTTQKQGQSQQVQNHYPFWKAHGLYFLVGVFQQVSLLWDGVAIPMPNPPPLSRLGTCSNRKRAPSSRSFLYHSTLCNPEVTFQSDLYK